MQTHTSKPRISDPVIPVQAAELRPSAWRVYANGMQPQLFDTLPKAITHANHYHGNIVPLAEVEA